MIRLLCNPLSAALPAGWKKNAGLAPGSVHDARCSAGRRRRSKAGTIDYGTNDVSPNKGGLVVSSPPFAPWRLAGDSPGDGSALPPGAGSWFSPGSPGFVDAGRMEILATLVTGIVDRRFKLECELYAASA